MGRHRAAWTTAIAIALALVAAGSASAFRFKSCISPNGSGPCVSAGNTNALDLPSAVAVSSDGRFVYSTAFAGAALAWYSRDPSTGGLTLRGCIRGPDGVGPCTALGNDRALNGARALVISPDGKQIYVAAQAGDALTAFTRNPDTGAVQFLRCWTTNVAPGCLGLNNGILDDTFALAMSPDGDELYVAGANQSTVGVFARNTSTGELTTPSCIGGAPECVDLAGGNAPLANPSALAVSPGGTYLYLAASNADAVSIFQTDQSTHSLTFRGCVGASSVAGCTSIDNAHALDGPAALLASRDGAHLYVAAAAGNAIGVFNRNVLSGALSFAGCRGATSLGPCTGVGNSNAITGPRALAMNPAGTRVYSAAGTGNAIASFARSSGDPLAFLGCVGGDAAGPCTSASNATAFSEPVSLAPSPDGRHVYAAASGGPALTVLGSAPPSCGPRSAATPFQTPIRLAFGCAEPDGDPVSYSLAGAAHGSLSGLDPNAGSVVYTPNAGFSGPDGFRFGAVDIDGTATAPASIAVGAPPIVTPPKPITSPLRNRWAAGPRRTEIIVLLARLVPGDATVQVRCIAPRRLGRRACPFKRKSVKPRSDLASVNLKKLFGKRRKLRVGVRIQIRITAPNSIGKVVTYRMRRSRLPRSVSRCLPPGATKPVRC